MRAFLGILRMFKALVYSANVCLVLTRWQASSEMVKTDKATASRVFYPLEGEMGELIPRLLGG